MSRKSCIVVANEKMQEVFGEQWWNDTEDIYCVPVTRENSITPIQAKMMIGMPEFDGWISVDFIIGTENGK